MGKLQLHELIINELMFFFSTYKEWNCVEILFFLHKIE